MACRYYDDLITARLKKWVGPNSNIRVLKPDESRRLFELTADDNKDQEFKLPLIAVSRDTSIELLSTVKQEKSFMGLQIYQDKEKTVQMNVIPIKLQYQIDIYTKTYDDGDEYLREFLFKLINNPAVVIELPYNDSYVRHKANIRILNTVSDTSSISERIFSGQFTRWTIQLELQDAFLFSIPYRKNWKLYLDDLELVNPNYMDACPVPEELPDILLDEVLPIEEEFKMESLVTPPERSPKKY